jgi:hypothetical protein
MLARRSTKEMPAWQGKRLLIPGAGSSYIHGDVLDQILGKGDQHLRHPGQHQKDAEKDCNDLRHKRERKLLNLGYCLEKTYEQSDHKAVEQSRPEGLGTSEILQFDGQWKLLQ